MVGGRALDRNPGGFRMASSCRGAAAFCLIGVLVASGCAGDGDDAGPAVGASDQALLNASNAFVPTWETTPPTKGTISSGTYAATQVDDTTFEQLSEAKSGSKHLLDHTWKITDVTGTGALFPWTDTSAASNRLYRLRARLP